MFPHTLLGLVAILLATSASSPARADDTRREYADEHAWGVAALHLQEHMDLWAPLARSFWPGAHNAYSSKNWGYVANRNQHLKPIELLEAGIRELTYDIHPRLKNSEYKPYLCHMFGAEAATCGGEGDRSLREGLKHIRDWIVRGNRDSVVLLKIEAYDSDFDGGHLRKIGQDINDILGDLAYAPKDHADQECGSLPVDRLKKRDILSTGANVVIVTTAKDARCSYYKQDTFRDWVWIGLDRFDADGEVSRNEKFKNANTLSDCQATEMAIRDQNPIRAVDDTYGDDNVEIKASEVLGLAECGVNIVEAAYIGQSDRNAPDSEDFVWGWGEDEPNNAGGEDCVLTNPSGRLNDAPCATALPFACRRPDNTWYLSAESGPWSQGLAACGSDQFAVPWNAHEHKRLRYVMSQAGVTRAWIYLGDQRFEGLFVPGASTVDGGLVDRAIVGGTGSTRFDHTDFLARKLMFPDLRLTGVKVRSGNRVDGITMEYSDGTSVFHGQEGGTAVDLSGRDVTGYEVCIGSYNKSDRVFALELRLSDGAKLSFGRESFKSSGKKRSAHTCHEYGGAGNDRSLFAIKGYAGEEIDALGFYFIEG